MAVANFPFYVVVSPAAEVVVGKHRAHVAHLALRAMLAAGRGLEVAYQQIVFQGQDLAFASRVTPRGDLVVEIDLGSAHFRDRVVLSSELRKAAEEARSRGRR